MTCTKQQIDEVKRRFEIVIDDFIEQGADIEHERWSKWQSYMFSKCKKQSDGSLVIPPWAVARWTDQINTKFSELSESEKESDRREVKTYIPLIKEIIKQVTKIYVEENKT